MMAVGNANTSWGSERWQSGLTLAAVTELWKQQQETGSSVLALRISVYCLLLSVKLNRIVGLVCSHFSLQRAAHFSLSIIFMFSNRFLVSFITSAVYSFNKAVNSTGYP